MILLLALLLPISFLVSCCFKTPSIRTQAKKKYKPGHIPVFEDPEKPENSTQYDMKTERFFPKKGEDNPFEEDCKDKTEKSQKDIIQMQPSSADDSKDKSKEKSREKEKVSPGASTPAAPAAAAAAPPKPAAVQASPSPSPVVQSTQPSVPTPVPAH